MVSDGILREEGKRKRIISAHLKVMVRGMKRVDMSYTGWPMPAAATVVGGGLLRFRKIIKFTNQTEKSCCWKTGENPESLETVIPCRSWVEVNRSRALLANYVWVEGVRRDETQPTPESQKSFWNPRYLLEKITNSSLVPELIPKDKVSL